MPILHFKGKSVIQNHHHTVKFHELQAVKSKGTSKEPSLDDNLIIHGDNLIALKALLPTYAGKVKCIYIDPPYNTGNEHWKYNDNVNSPMIKEWLGKEVARDDLTRHDKWCCMMYPRLTLLRELLAENGAIFVSIDENEVHHLRQMMDEVFGEANLLAQITWERKKEKSNDGKGISNRGEYLIAYSKSDSFELPREELSKDYIEQSYKFEDKRGRWRPVPITLDAGHQGGGYAYEVKCPSGKTIEREWRMPESTYTKLLEDDLIYFGKKGDGIPQRKMYLEDSSGTVPDNLWVELTTNKEGKKEILEIFGEELFETPKPSKLVKRILQVVSQDSDCIVLDSFAGSGTTAHAVLALNAEDGGKRRFILVECEDYADKLTAERVRRVSKGMKDSKDEKLKKGLGGSFSFYELGNPIDIDKMLEGDNLPSYENLAHYAFFTATGETFNPKKMNEKELYVGSSNTYEVFMLYTSNADKLRGTALNLEFAQKIEKKFPGKPKLVFAPACYLEEFDLRERNIRFAQLPFEIYRLAD